jgi:hypothetical protein
MGAVIGVVFFGGFLAYQNRPYLKRESCSSAGPLFNPYIGDTHVC